MPARMHQSGADSRRSRLVAYAAAVKPTPDTITCTVESRNWLASVAVGKITAMSVSGRAGFTALHTVGNSPGFRGWRLKGLRDFSGGGGDHVGGQSSCAGHRQYRRPGSNLLCQRVRTDKRRHENRGVHGRPRRSRLAPPQVAGAGAASEQDRAAGGTLLGDSSNGVPGDQRCRCQGSWKCAHGGHAIPGAPGAPS